MELWRELYICLLYFQFTFLRTPQSPRYVEQALAFQKDLICNTKQHKHVGTLCQEHVPIKEIPKHMLIMFSLIQCLIFFFHLLESSIIILLFLRHCNCKSSTRLQCLSTRRLFAPNGNLELYLEPTVDKNRCSWWGGSHGTSTRGQIRCQVLL